jgi:hypothetical protein
VDVHSKLPSVTRSLIESKIFFNTLPCESSGIKQKGSYLLPFFEKINKIYWWINLDVLLDHVCQCDYDSIQFHMPQPTEKVTEYMRPQVKNNHYFSENI